MHPELSVVICMVSGGIYLENCLNALAKQVDAPEMEIIVPYDYRDNEMVAVTSK